VDRRGYWRWQGLRLALDNDACPGRKVRRQLLCWHNGIVHRQFAAGERCAGRNKHACAHGDYRSHGDAYINGDSAAAHQHAYAHRNSYHSAKPHGVVDSRHARPNWTGYREWRRR
jgi:hypothetical protein